MGEEDQGRGSGNASWNLQVKTFPTLTVNCQLSTVGEYFCKSTFSMMGIPLHHMGTGTLCHISINFLPVDNDFLSFYPPVFFNGECVNEFCH